MPRHLGQQCLEAADGGELLLRVRPVLREVGEAGLDEAEQLPV